MLSKTSIGIAAAGAGICFLGYCIYFDKKRRSDPDFRQKLKESKSYGAFIDYEKLFKLCYKS
jgi:import receptor subunit TOM20